MPETLEPIRWKVKTVIDGHTHCRGDEPVAHYLDNCDLAGHTKGVVLTWRGLKDYGEDRPVFQLKKEHPSRFYIYGGLLHDEKSIARGDGRALAGQVDELLARGFDGIKMMEGSPYFKKELPHPLDHEYYRPFWSAAEEKRMPITIHLANPLDCWQGNENAAIYRDAEPQEEYFRQAEAVLEAHPKLRITFAHFMFMGPQLDRLDKLFARYSEMSVDLAMGQDYMYFLSEDVEKSRAFFVKWQQRILYGTDLNDRNSLKLARAKCDQVRLFLETGSAFVNQTSLAMNQPPLAGPKGRTELHGLNLPQEALENILHGNVERLLGKEPRSQRG